MVCLFSHFCFLNIMASLLMKYTEMKNSQSSSTFNKYYTWILKFLQSKSLLIKPGKIPEKRAFQHWVPQMLWRVLSLVININIDLLASQSLTELWKLWDAHASPKSFILVRYICNVYVLTRWNLAYGNGLLIVSEVMLWRRVWGQ